MAWAEMVAEVSPFTWRRLPHIVEPGTNLAAFNTTDCLQISNKTKSAVLCTVESGEMVLWGRKSGNQLHRIQQNAVCRVICNFYCRECNQTLQFLPALTADSPEIQTAIKLQLNRNSSLQETAMPLFRSFSGDGTSTAGRQMHLQDRQRLYPQFCVDRHTRGALAKYTKIGPHSPVRETSDFPSCLPTAPIAPTGRQAAAADPRGLWRP